MKKTAKFRLGAAAALSCLGFLLPPVAKAEQVYKCVEGGKTRFTSEPGGGPGCQSMELNVPQPNPVDVARQMERNREYEREQKAWAQRRRDEMKSDPEVQRRIQAEKLGEAVAKSPLPKLPGSSNGRGRSNYR